MSHRRICASSCSPSGQGLLSPAMSAQHSRAAKHAAKATPPAWSAKRAHCHCQVAAKAWLMTWALSL